MHTLPQHFALSTPRRGRREVLKAVCIATSGLALLGGCAEPLPPLRVGSVVYPAYELMFLARDVGALDERQIRLIEMRSNADLLRALAAGQLEAAQLNFDELIAARADGLDLRAVLVLDVSVGADAVVTRAPVKLQQLRGARLGVTGTAVGDVVLNAMLRAGGLTLGEVRRVRLDTVDAERALFAGQVDGLVASEPLVSRLQSRGGHRMFDSASMDGRVVNVLAVRADVLGPRDVALQHLVSRFFAAQQEFLNHVQRASEQMATRLGVDAAGVSPLFKGVRLLDAAHNRKMLAPRGGLQQVIAAVQQEGAAMARSARTLVLEDLVDTRFVTP